MKRAKFMAIGVILASLAGAQVAETRPASTTGVETLSFPIVADETDGPPDGAIVKLSLPTREGVPPPPTGKVVGRTIVVEGVSLDCEDILATAPDGTMADLPFTEPVAFRSHLERREDGKTRTGWAKFKKPRTLALTVRDKKGAPLAGYRAQCRSMRTEWKFVNCTMSEPIPFDPAGPIVTLDATGSARIEGLPPDTYYVAVWKATAPDPVHGINGGVDLSKPGEGRADLVLECARRCVVQVTVDGQKKLPPRVAARDDWLERIVGPIEEDPAEGTLRFEMRPHKEDTSLEVTVSGAGCAEASYGAADLVLKLPADPSVVLEGRVELISGGDVRLHVVAPADGVHEVVLEMKDGRKWVPIEGHASFIHERLADRYSFRQLPPGFYRARDTRTGVTTADVLLHGGRVGDLTIDLSRPESRPTSR